jgi:DedD protein
VSRQTDSKPPSSGWVVQVGTFSNAANAARLEQKLRAQRQPVLTERVDVNGTSAVRLRVGPFRDRAAALKARERINKDVGVKGVVLAYP